MKLTAEDLEKVRTKNIANILRKQADGKTLTASEQKALSDAVAGPGIDPDAGNYAKSWDDLARALNVEERTLYNFRQRHAGQIHELRATLTRPDGRHVIAEWRKLADEFGELNGRGFNDSESDHINERELRLRERRFEVERAEHRLKLQKREVLPLTEYQAALRITVGAFDAALKQIPGRAAEQLVVRAREAVLAMLRAELTEKQFAKVAAILETAPIDHAGIVEILDHELEACRRALAEADFLEPDPDLA